MRMLQRKLVRDLWGLRSQILAIAAVLACGIGTFVMSASTVRSLEQTRAQYYVDYHFADIFCDLKRAPENVVDRLRELNGIRICDSRTSILVRLNLEKMREPAQAQILTLPTGQGLNGIHLRQGRYPIDDSEKEVVVSEAFSIAHRLEPGDTVEAVIDGKLKALEIVGVGLSPEFIYEIAPGGLLPDNKSFGVFWMNRKVLAAAAGMTGAFNQVSMSVSPDAELDGLIRQIDEELDVYGGQGAIARKDQRSHRFISSEMDELRNMGIVAPTIFLCVASFLMNMVLSRLISTQREQIAALKAFGFTRWEIARHFLAMAWIIAGIGTIVGIGVGMLLGQYLTQLYSRFFHFPSFVFSIPGYVIIAAGSISGAAATIGVWTSIRQVMKLQPAEAMRPEPPQRYRRNWTDVVTSLLSLGPSSRMVIRHLVRKPRRATLSVFGISLAVAVLILGSFMQDAVFSMFDSLFRLSKKYEIQVVFREPIHESVRFELQSIDGVLACELFRAVSVRARYEQRERLLAIQGVEPNAQLSLLVDGKNHVRSLPASGLMISRKLADVLGVQIGQELELEALEEERKTFRLPVTGQIDDLVGESIYLARSELTRMLAETPRVNGAYLAIDTENLEETLRQLRERPGIAMISVTSNLKESFFRTIAENVRRMRSMNMVFSMIIAVGVIYSTARISLAERSRDLATMRVLGYSHGEIRSILIGELFLLTSAAIPIGWSLGYGLAYTTVNAFDRELFRMPLVIHGSTYAYAAGVVWVAMLVASWIVQRHLRELSIVEVLKARE